jgi:hypothetical protein
MQRKKTYLFLSLGIFFLLFVVHLFATMTSLYWITGWFDSVSHLIGGFGIFFFLSYSFSLAGKRLSLVVLIVFSVLIGILWELFQLKYGITLITSPSYWLSTSTDISYGVIGSLAGYLLTKK